MYKREQEYKTGLRYFRDLKSFKNNSKYPLKNSSREVHEDIASTKLVQVLFLGR